MKRDKALVTFKLCPHCGGSGSVPCSGREKAQQDHLAWAAKFHHQLVSYQYDETLLAGVAEAEYRRGGWWGLRIYVAVSELPGRSTYTEYEPGLYSCFGRGNFPVPVYTFTIVNGKAFWFLPCGYSNREQLELLVKPNPELEGMLKALPVGLPS